MEHVPVVLVVAGLVRAFLERCSLVSPRRQIRASPNQYSGTKAASQAKETTMTAPAFVVSFPNMELGGDGTSGAVAKRQREGSVNTEGTEVPSSAEPPAKAVSRGPSSFKTKANVASDRPTPPGLQT
ncbi:uncharacterized protein LOC144174229 [Haemaphysalis longicornis]